MFAIGSAGMDATIVLLERRLDLNGQICTILRQDNLTPSRFHVKLSSGTLVKISFSNLVVLTNETLSFCSEDLQAKLEALRPEVKFINCTSALETIPHNTTLIVTYCHKLLMAARANPHTLYYAQRTAKNTYPFFAMTSLCRDDDKNAPLQPYNWMAFASDNFARGTSESIDAITRLIINILPGADSCSCAVCLEEFGDDSGYVLQCGHSFHAQCIQRIYQSACSVVCPLCRYCDSTHIVRDGRLLRIISQ